MPFSSHPSSLTLDSGGPAPARAHRIVLDAIASGSTAAGELLTEGEVASELDMSRTPVREAFVRLAGEGLLTLYPKRGAIVTAVDERESRDLLDARLMFETTAVRWVAERGVPRDLPATLHALLENQRTALAGDSLAFARADRALHEAVVLASGNAVVGALFAQTGPRLLRLIHRVAEGGDALRAQIAAEHEQLVRLALAADAEGYGSLLRSHVEEGHRVR